VNVISQLETPLLNLYDWNTELEYCARRPAKKPGSARLCGWQVFFGLIFFVTFFHQGKKVKLSVNNFKI